MASVAVPRLQNVFIRLSCSCAAFTPSSVSVVSPASVAPLACLTRPASLILSSSLVSTVPSVSSVPAATSGSLASSASAVSSATLASSASPVSSALSVSSACGVAVTYPLSLSKACFSSFSTAAASLPSVSVPSPATGRIASLSKASFSSLSSAPTPSSASCYSPFPQFATPKAPEEALALKKDKLLWRIKHLKKKMLGENLANYFNLVENGDMYAAEYNRILRLAAPFIDDEEVNSSLGELNDLLDHITVLEDTRDHLNELMEQMSRKSGIAGIGLNAAEPVENVDEHAERLSQIYDELKKGTYFQSSSPASSSPASKATMQHSRILMEEHIENVLGYGLALLRQRHKYHFSTMHRYFF